MISRLKTLCILYNSVAKHLKFRPLAYSERNRTSKVEFIEKIVNGFQPLFTFIKSPNLDLGSENASVAGAVKQNFLSRVVLFNGIINIKCWLKGLRKWVTKKQLFLKTFNNKFYLTLYSKIGRPC